MKGSEHGKSRLKNFELGSNFIEFEKNLCKTFYGGLTDLKYVPKRIELICHNAGKKCNLCLLEVYRMYIGLVECKVKESDGFYLRAAKHKFSFEKSPVLQSCQICVRKLELIGKRLILCELPVPLSYLIQALKKNSFVKGPDIGLGNLRSET